PVPGWFMAPVAPEDVTTALGWPVIVKPSKMGSSVGMTLVRNAEGLDAAVEVARAYDAEVMAEQFIPGRELTVGVLGDVPLPVGEIIPKHELFDYECKYTPGMSEELFPAKLDTALARQLQELALTAHRALKLGGYSRVDFRLSPEGDIFCLEANTLPGMTRTSLLPQAARAAGIEFPELCERICRLAGNSGSAPRSFALMQFRPVTLVVGASAAVYGVLLAFAWAWPDQPINVFLLPTPIPAKWLVTFYVAVTLVLALLSTSDGVAHLAHLGG